MSRQCRGHGQTNGASGTLAHFCNDNGEQQLEIVLFSSCLRTSNVLAGRIVILLREISILPNFVLFHVCT